MVVIGMIGMIGTWMGRMDAASEWPGTALCSYQPFLDRVYREPQNLKGCSSKQTFSVRPENHRTPSIPMLDNDPCSPNGIFDHSTVGKLKLLVVLMLHMQLFRQGLRNHSVNGTRVYCGLELHRLTTIYVTDFNQCRERTHVNILI